MKDPVYPDRIYSRVPSHVHASYYFWLDGVKSCLEHRPGGKASLARTLNVTPQRLNHWLTDRMMPGWAVVYINHSLR